MPQEIIKGVLGGVETKVIIEVENLLKEIFPNEDVQVDFDTSLAEVYTTVGVSRKDPRIQLILVGSDYYKKLVPSLKDEDKLWEEGGVIMEYINSDILKKNLYERFHINNVAKSSPTLSGNNVSEFDESVNEFEDYAYSNESDIDDDYDINNFFDFEDLQPSEEEISLADLNTEAFVQNYYKPNTVDAPFSVTDYNNMADFSKKMKGDNDSLSSELDQAYKTIHEYQLRLDKIGDIEELKRDVQLKQATINKQECKIDRLETSLEQMTSEYTKLQEEYKKEKKIESTKKPENPIQMKRQPLTIKGMYNDITICFSGSFAGNRLASISLYKQLKAEAAKGDILFIDLSAESYSLMDFGIPTKAVPTSCIEFLSNPNTANIAKYITRSNVPNLSCMFANRGNPYNISWLCTLDWDKIFKAINRPCYIYLGPICNEAVMSLYAGLAPHVNSEVFIDGNPPEIVLFMHLLGYVPVLDQTKAWIYNRKNTAQAANFYSMLQERHHNTGYAVWG